MAAAELGGGDKPKLNEALGWIGSRVDDLYGASVGRLEDVWIDPGTGVPRWLLVREAQFDGRTTLIPFEDATAGAGHVWVPYERDVVCSAPGVEPGTPLTQHVEAALRTHYAANVPSPIAYGIGGRIATERPIEPAPLGAQQGVPATTATIRFQPPTEAGVPDSFSARWTEREPPIPPQRMDPRGLRPGWQDGGVEQRSYAAASSQPVPPPAPEQGPPQQPYVDAPPPQPHYAGGWQQPAPDPAQEPLERLRALAEAGGSHYVEIELSGELTIRGELRTVRVIPRGGADYGPGRA